MRLFEGWPWTLCRMAAASLVCNRSSSFQKPPQSKRGLLALAVGHSDGSLMTLICLSHYDVRTSPSGGHKRAPDLTPIMCIEQQRLTLFDAELSQGCSVGECDWVYPIRAIPAKLRAHGNTPQLQALVVNRQLIQFHGRYANGRPAWI